MGATTIGKTPIKGTEKIIVANCNIRIFLGVKLIRTIPNAELKGEPRSGESSEQRERL